MKKKLLLFAAACALICMYRCDTTKDKEKAEAEKIMGPIMPLPFPDSAVTGIRFPQDSNIINGWLASQDTTSIYAHGWGIWAGLTDSTKNKVGDDYLYVYETWPSPLDLIEILSAQKEAGLSAMTRTRRSKLQRPRQFEHGAHNKLLTMMKKAPAAKVMATPCNTPTWNTGVYPLAVTVNYNEPAATHILKNKLFDSSALAKMLSSGMTDIPDFPNNSIVIKPTYMLVPKAAIDQNGFFKLRVYTSPNFCDSGYGNNQWQGVIYIDINNHSSGNGSVDTGNGGKPKPECSYNLNSFIHFTVKGGDVANLDSGNQSGNNVTDTIAYAGNIAILVGMHVTTKEIKRWTWQSFWWTPTPNNPPFPSSAAIAGVAHPKVKGAASHYAMSSGYTFIWPNQPYSGGASKGTPIYAFNPFLEAGFAGLAPSTVQTPSGPVTSTIGLRTNCMSCHALATYQNAPISGQLGTYNCDMYIDMVKDTTFTHRLKLDFMWSIQDDLIAK